MDELAPPTQRLADRLSTLPDPILAEILSLVPTKTAVTTSVLSTRWRSVWTQITSVHLDYNHFPQHSSEFYTIVNHLLLTQLTSPILRTFYLHAPFRGRQHFESWFRHLSARNVEIIDINVEDHYKLSDTTPGPPFTIPLCIFQTQSLVCLYFRPSRLDYVLPVDPHTVVNLPNLKPSALSEASIITVYPEVVEPLMPVLLDVRVLHILGVKLKMFDDFKDDKGNLLIFHNLTELKLELSTEGVDELTIYRLKSSSPCLLLKVKKISLVVSSVEYGLNLKKLAHYFLGNSPALERLSFVLGPQARQSEDGVKFRLDEMVFCMDLYSCSRESSGCLIEFQGQYAKVPANIAEFQDMENQVVLLRESLSPVDADAVRAS